jgi:hypothetical protein
MVAEVAAAQADTEVAARAAKQEVEKAQASADGKMKEYVDKFREQVGQEAYAQPFAEHAWITAEGHELTVSIHVLGCL